MDWYNGVLYQESQLPVELSDDPSDLNVTSLTEAVQRGVGIQNAYIDWNEVNKVAKKHLGIPQVIGEKAPGTHEAYRETETKPKAMSYNQDDSSNYNQADSAKISLDNYQTVTANENEIFSQNSDNKIRIQIKGDDGVRP